MLFFAADPTVVIRFLMIGLTVTTGVGMVGSGIAVGTVLARTQFAVQGPIVVVSQATVVVDRTISSSEIPLFSDAVGTMQSFADQLKAILKAEFGGKFINLQYQSFSAAPIVTSLVKILPTSRRRKRYIPFNKPGGQSSINTTFTSTTSIVTSSPVPNCCDNSSTINITNCTSPSSDQICNKTFYLAADCIRKYQNITDCIANLTGDASCEWNTNNTVSCENITISYPDCLNTSWTHKNCNSTSATGKPPTTTTTTTTTKTSTTATVTIDCNNPTETASQPSIINSQVQLFFQVGSPEELPVRTILATLGKFMPPVTLYTKCLTTSTKIASFDSQLSKVEAPIQVNKDPQTLANAPTVPSEVINNVGTAAEIALNLYLNQTNTTLPTTAATLVTNVMVG